ncbi:MAG: SUMF1/EgtB/PvdO family nonheme iron enzyme [Planctomycetes bacterium]|nr:SUMF1/EgtB/PvdO family nonheme iron enzyme [Planctomycetota bacterium]
MDPSTSFSDEALEAFAELEARRAGALPEGTAPADPRTAEELAALRALGGRVDRLLHGILADGAAVRSALDSLGLAPQGPGSEARDELARLARMAGSTSRYTLSGELARGGMSTVWRVRDTALDRELAMKVADERSGMLPRFLAEARFTGRLDHPGVVPVHELGVDEHGRAYFTMPLVRGRTFTDVIDLARARREGWTPMRAIDVLLKVCDTVAYAHSLGVVHRDLKPDNVLVGRFGAVYVVDWGLARQVGGVEPGVITEQDAAATFADQHTLAGAVLGTPSYMAPEQAAGRNEELGPRTDVYALGAVLYRLLAGVAPYCDGEARPSSQAVLEAVRAGPPREVETLAADADAELAAICRRAMQRDPTARYANVEELAADLRAYLEGRVVSARPSGAWVQLSKWVRRNRALSSALGLVLALLVAGLVAVTWSERRRAQDSERAAAEVRFEADQRAPVALRDAAARLWPSLPEQIPALEAWLAEAGTLVARRAEYARARDALRRTGRPADVDHPREVAARTRLAARLAALRSEAAGHEQDVLEFSGRAFGPGREQGLAYAYAHLDRLAPRIAALEERLASPQAWLLADALADQRAAALAELVDAIEEFADPIEGPIAAVQSRLDRARRVPDAAALASDPAWRAALEDLADPERSPLYRGLRIAPQVGLEPLRRNPASGLWEFLVLGSGERPRAHDDGAYGMGPTAGIVLVLVPGGPTRLGVRALEPLPRELLRAGELSQGTRRDLELDPFFLSKYELTQGQWVRATGHNPAYFRAGTTFGWPTHTLSFDLSYPVESVSWTEASEVLGRLGLVLPTEARLEHAYRAGTEASWSIPEAPWCLVGGVNAAQHGGVPFLHDLAAGYLPHDGFQSPAPVGWFTANAWGFHEVHGNVGEWAQDVFRVRWGYAMREGDGLHLAPESGLRVVRGGTWGHTLNWLTSWHREDQAREFRSWGIGVRPARDVRDP